MSVSATDNQEFQLIRRAQAGDRDAFGELYIRNQAHVHRFLFSRMPAREVDAQDLITETFVVAMQHISSFDLERPGEFGNWLVGIARNKLLQWREASQRAAAIDERCIAAAARAVSVSPEEMALDQLAVAEALSRLSPRMRRALLLRHAAVRCAEVALELGTTKSEVWALTRQARAALRGEVRLCACGCGRAIRPERWDRDRYARPACARHAAERSCDAGRNEGCVAVSSCAHIDETAQ